MENVLIVIAVLLGLISLQLFYLIWVTMIRLDRIDIETTRIREKVTRFMKSHGLE
ncbi:hypothetical protein SAMN05421647_1147 [Marinobacterium stanieri]|uniref:Uncharacterized protein n=1 Tax=Marinobacterium stanieri TaxID=49186 RepID=A0A1N6XG91_9GAMM|nr:hypothetical protein SAMN05421647_1147 [Marinobacterium stanieri]